MNKKKVIIPTRMCIATFKRYPKQELLRLVRTKGGEISLDLTGRKEGRGVYLSTSLEAVQIAKKKKRFERYLKAAVSDQFLAHLNTIILEKANESKKNIIVTRTCKKSRKSNFR